MEYRKICGIIPVRRRDGIAKILLSMEFSSDKERDALLARAGLPAGSDVVPSMGFMLRLDGALEPLSLSLDGKGVHGGIKYYRVTNRYLDEIRKELARRCPGATWYRRGELARNTSGDNTDERSDYDD